MHLAIQGTRFPSGQNIRQAFSPQSLMGLGSLVSLGATVNQCEEWRKAAAWITPGLTDVERRDAAGNFNTECRGTDAGSAASAAAVIESGGGETKLVPSVAVSVPPRPTQTGDLALEKYTIPASNCGPLDTACVSCNNQVLSYNMAQRELQRQRYYRARDERTCLLNRANGYEASACGRMDDPLPPGSPAPVCSVTYDRSYVSPAATVDESGAIVVDRESGASFYTQLPESQITGEMPLLAYGGPAIPVAPTVGQPGVVSSGNVFSRLADQFQQVVSPGSEDGETNGFPWMLAIVAAGGLYLISKK